MNERDRDLLKDIAREERRRAGLFEEIANTPHEEVGKERFVSLLRTVLDSLAKEYDLLGNICKGRASYLN